MTAARRGLLLLLLALGLTVAAPGPHDASAVASVSAASVSQATLPARVEAVRAYHVATARAPLPAGEIGAGLHLPAASLARDRQSVAHVAPYTSRETRSTRGPPGD